MKIIEKFKSLFAGSDGEWAPDENAGDENAYDGLAVVNIPYNHSQFEVEDTDGN